MVKYTPNYNLGKPEGTDKYSVLPQNTNMDIVDAALKEIDSIAKSAEMNSTEAYTDATTALEKSTKSESTLIAHLGQMATTEVAGHVMLVDDLTTGGSNKAASAETVKALKAESDKAIKVNAYVADNVQQNLGSNSARRNFGNFSFQNSTTSEYVLLEFDATDIFGMMKINLSSSYGEVNASGGAEIIAHVGYTNGNLYTDDLGIVSMSEEFALAFFVNNFYVENGKLKIAFFKREKNVRLGIDIEFFSISGNAWSVLGDVTVTQVVRNDVISAPIQQSIFTSVSNGKATVNQAVTDMGIYTPPDATFATTAANIKKISGSKVGTMYVPALSPNGSVFVDVSIPGITPKNACNILGGMVMVDGVVGGVSTSPQSGASTIAISVSPGNVRFMIGTGPSGTWNGGNVKYVIS